MSEQEKSASLTQWGKQLVADVCAGAADRFLMKKYGLSKRGLQRLLDGLIAAKAISHADLDRHVAAAESICELVEGVEEPTPSSPRLQVIHSAGVFRNVDGVQIFWSSCHGFSGE